MNIYSPREVAELLNIKTATLRKYAIMLEEAGYTIERNDKRHRYYRDKDIITLRRLIEASNNGITLQEASKNIVQLNEHSNQTNVIHNDKTQDNNDIEELKKMVLFQSELIHQLIERLDNQEERTDHLLNRLETEEHKGIFKRLFRR